MSDKRISYSGSSLRRRKFWEVLACRQIVVLGTGLYSQQICGLLRDAVQNGSLDANRSEVVICLDEQPNASFREPPFPCVSLPELLQREIGPSSALFVGLIDNLTRDHKRLMSKGFAHLIDAKSLLVNEGAPLYFQVEGYPEDREAPAALDRDASQRVEEIRTVLDGKSFLDSPELCGSLAAYLASQGKPLAAAALLRMVQAKAFGPIHEELATTAQWEDLEVLENMELGIYLNFFGRSGSIFFGSLLDGNRDIIKMPSPLILDPYFALVSLFLTHKGPVQITDLANCFLYRNRIELGRISIHTADHTPLLSEQYLNRFSHSLQTLLRQKACRTNGVISEKFLIQASHYAHAKALGFSYRRASFAPFFVYDSHDEEEIVVEKFFYLFPASIQLMTVRDSMKSFVSSLNCLMEERGNLTRKDISYYLNYYAMNPIFANAQIMGRTLAVPIEAVNKDNNVYMDWLFACLGIKTPPQTTGSTLNYKNIMLKYNKSNKKYKYSDYLAERDSRVVSAVFACTLKLLEYPADEAAWEGEMESTEFRLANFMPGDPGENNAWILQCCKQILLRLRRCQESYEKPKLLR